MSTMIRPLHVAFAGFCIAAFGVFIGFLAFNFETRWAEIVAFVITVFGVLIGFSGVIYGWIVLGSPAIFGSAHAAEELAGKIKKIFNIHSR
jgi:hypothetical protein